MNANSHRTAITRKHISLPTRYLLENNLLHGNVVDYGCGKGMNADILSIDKYDPYYFPMTITKKYDTVICNYVLNVIPDEADRQDVISAMKLILKKQGTIYISVRADKKNLNGWTKKKTWQGLIELDYPTIEKNSNFVMYEIKDK